MDLTVATLDIDCGYIIIFECSLSEIVVYMVSTAASCFTVYSVKMYGTGVGEQQHPSVRSLVVDKERMRPGHWLDVAFCVAFSALTLVVG